MEEIIQELQVNHANVHFSVEEMQWLKKLACYIQRFLYKEGELSKSHEEFVRNILTTLIKVLLQNLSSKHNQDAYLGTGLPISLQPTSLKDLPSIQEQSGYKLPFRGCIFKESDVNQDEQLNSNASYLIMGCLTLSPQNQPKKTSGELFLEDNACSLPCKVSLLHESHVNQIVLISDWKYVPVDNTTFHQGALSESVDAIKGYLEVTGEIIPLSDITNQGVSEPRHVQDIHCPCFFRKTKRDKKRLKSVNIFGKITAMSLPHRVGDAGDAFILLELSCFKNNYSFVIILQNRLLSWFTMLSVGEGYVFFNFKETTMNKGSNSEQKVLAGKTGAHFTKFDGSKMDVQCYLNVHMSSGKTATCSSLDEFASLKPKKAKFQDVSSLTPHLPVERHASTNDNILMAYTGTITKYIRPDCGVYELDNKIRLFVGQLPWNYGGLGLRVGAEVTLHNVHFSKHGKKVLGLCCCTLSTVKVTKFSSLDDNFKSISVLKRMSKHCQIVSIHHFVWLLELSETLNTRFNKVIRKESSEFQLGDKMAIDILKKIVNVGADGLSRRNVFSEFCSSPHDCFITRPSAFPDELFPSLDSFVKYILKNDGGQMWKSGKNNQIYIPGRSDYSSGEWKYRVVSSQDLNNEVLVGVLATSSHTGHVTLRDQTSEIPCLIVPCTQDVNHSCWKNCKPHPSMSPRSTCVQSTVEYQSTKCPYMQTWYSNKVICLKTYEVIVERHQMSPKVGDKTECIETVYLRFDIENAVILNSLTVIDLERTRQKELQEEQEQANVQSHCVIFMVCRKDHPSWKPCKREQFLSFTVESKFLGGVQNVIKGKDIISDHFKCNNSDNKVLRKKPVDLIFGCDALRWYPLLYPGCLYLLQEFSTSDRQSILSEVSQCTEKASVMNLLSSKQFRIKRLSAPLTSTEIRADNLVMFQNEMELDIFVKGCNELVKEHSGTVRSVSVDKILNAGNGSGKCEKTETQDKSRYGESSKSNHIFSVSGLIVQREVRLGELQATSSPKFTKDGEIHVPNHGVVPLSEVKSLDLGYYFLRNNTLSLLLQSHDSLNQLYIYLNMNTQVYQYGLIPGTIVQFRDFIRKSSKSGNIYLSFSQGSSICIDSLGTSFIRQEKIGKVMPSSSKAMTCLPQHYLLDFLQENSSSNMTQGVVSIRCRVSAVQKAVIKWTCGNCGAPVSSGECSRLCKAQVAKFSAEVRCVIDDGTAEAQLYVYDHLVPVLLKISNQQWATMKSQALQFGENVYQRNWYGGDNPWKPKGTSLSSQETQAKLRLAECCTSTYCRRLLNVYCKRICVNQQKQQQMQATAVKVASPYDERTITVAGTEFTTLVQKKLLLKAVDVTNVDIQAILRQRFS